MNAGLAFVLLIATIPLMFLLIFVLVYVISDGVVSSMYKKTSETTLITQRFVDKLKRKFE